MTNASGVSLRPRSVAWPLRFAARLLHLRDVGLVELRDVRQVHPARVQARPGDLLDPRQRLALDRAERGEIDGRDPRQCAAAGGRAVPRSGARAHA